MRAVFAIGFYAVRAAPGSFRHIPARARLRAQRGTLRELLRGGE